jgi:hypothetical protein
MCKILFQVVIGTAPVKKLQDMTGHQYLVLMHVRDTYSASAALAKTEA